MKLDPTMLFEIGYSQPENVNNKIVTFIFNLDIVEMEDEVKNICRPTVNLNLVDMTSEWPFRSSNNNK